jgi:predicted dehydrogenase
MKTDKFGAPGASSLVAIWWTLTTRVVLTAVVSVGGLLAGSPMRAAAGEPPPRATPLRVAIVGLSHGHVNEFLRNLPGRQDVELVGIAETDTTLWTKYGKRYALAGTLFDKSEANMIARHHPQAILVYTPISEHRHAIEIAAQYGVSAMVEKPLTISYEDALAIRNVALRNHVHVLVNYTTTWTASNHLVYDEAEGGRLGAIRRVVVYDGHQGAERDRLAAGVL